MGEESTGSRRKGFEKVILHQWVVAAKDQHGSSSVSHLPGSPRTGRSVQPWRNSDLACFRTYGMAPG